MGEATLIVRSTEIVDTTDTVYSVLYHHLEFCKGCTNAAAAVSVYACLLLIDKPRCRITLHKHDYDLRLLTLRPSEPSTRESPSTQMLCNIGTTLSPCIIGTGGDARAGSLQASKQINKSTGEGLDLMMAEAFLASWWKTKVLEIRGGDDRNNFQSVYLMI